MTLTVPGLLAGEETGLEPRPVWRTIETGSDASLRGLFALDASRAWATGSDGTVLTTSDGGTSWMPVQVPGTEALDFRDVELFDDGGAVLMTAGQPARLYRVESGASSVVLAHESPHAGAFFDAVAFWDDKRGLAFSDPVDGGFLVLATGDGGRSWQELDAGVLPAPLPGEAGFAASGSNLAVGEGGLAWIGTGGSAARVVRSADFGASWAVVETAMNLEAGTAGIFSVDFRDSAHGVAAGGDYQVPEGTAGTLSWSADGGANWEAASVPPPSGHRAAVRFVPGRPVPTWISVGRAGSDLSTDDGRTWQRFSEVGFYSLSVGGDGSVWAAGSDGRVARLEWPAPEASLPPPGEMARCKQMIDAGLYVGARTRLEPIVRDHPDWARATSLLALTYYKENRFEPARALFAQALAADPQEVAIRPLYGWTLYSLGELDAAQAMYESLLELRSDYSPAYYALGVIHLDRDEVDAARARLARSVELASQQGDRGMEGRARARLGDLHVRLDDLAQARSELELAVELFPDEYDALFKLSRVLQRLGDEVGAEDARKLFEETKARVRPDLAPPPG